MSELPSRFQVVRLLGRGTSGEVLEAIDREAGDRAVAVKRLLRSDAGSRARLENELRTVAHLRHPGLARVHELVQAAPAWLLVMELVNGRDFVRACGAPALEEQLRRGFANLVEAVTALHTAGALHRDLKPSHVLVDASGAVRLIDFGLVAALSPGGVYATPDGVVGTPAYMAPEQAAGEPLTPAADWYAVGVILYEALTGTLPHRGAPLEVMRQKQLAPPPHPRARRAGVPDDLAALAMELLALDAAKRPTASAIAARLSRRA